MGLQAASYVLLMGVMFGSMSVISRFMLEQFDPLAYTAVRLVLAALVFVFIYSFRIRGRRWPTDRVLWTRCILFGIIGDAIQISLFIAALQYLSSGLTATLATVVPVFTVIMAHFLLPNEKLTWKTGIGVALGMGGALLIMGLGETGLDTAQGSGWAGYLMLLTSGLILSLSTIYARKYMVHYDTWDSVSIRMISAAITAVLLTLILEPNGIHGVTPFGMLLLVVAAAVFFFGFLLSFYVLQQFGVTVTAMVNYIPPIIATILGAIFLSEKITAVMITGMVLILVGVAVINFNKRAPA